MTARNTESKSGFFLTSVNENFESEKKEPEKEKPMFEDINKDKK